MVNYPFNAFFVNFICYLKDFTKKKLTDKLSEGITLGEYDHFKEEFYSILEYLNDMLLIDAPLFNKFLCNVVISYFFIPVILDLLLIKDEGLLNQSECVLVLYLFMNKIKHDNLNTMLIKLLMLPEVDARFNDVNLDSYKPPFFYSFGYSAKPAIDLHNDDPIQGQLEQIYKKADKFKREKSSSWISDFMNVQLKSLKELGTTSNKTWHQNYTKFTGVVSNFGWEEELTSARDSNVVELLLNEKDQDTKQARNNLSTIFNQLLLVG